MKFCNAAKALCSTGLRSTAPSFNARSSALPSSVLLSATMSVLIVFCVSTESRAQGSAASEEYKVLKLEEGDWNTEMTMFMGPEGPYDPPQKSKGKESNRMIGDFWIVSDFKGEFGGMEFTGRGQFGYDASKKKYVGTWIDSLSPNRMEMVGTYDAAKKTMTYETSFVGMDGAPAKGKNTIVYGKDGHVMTMYVAAPGTDQMIKVMEISYSRQD